MKSELMDGAERLVWVEPIVESLDISATESNWGAGNDGNPASDTAAS
jgi:hypothetical protein